MQAVYDSLDLLKQINHRYELFAQNQEIDETLCEMGEAKVCMPIVGKFSSGKSALINALLGYRLLGEDIEPKTAVPTEIVYTDGREEVEIFQNDKISRLVSLDEYLQLVPDLDAETVKYVRMCLNNSFLREISSVMIVDMPGFESGYEVHNKAIDDYVTKSLAYVFAFPADDMIVRDSIGKLLKSLHQYDAPVLIVITKSDKSNDEDFEELLQGLRMSLGRYIQDREIPYVVTSSREGQVEEFTSYLRRIQDKAEMILTRKYARFVLDNYLDKTKAYLDKMLNNQALTLSELEEQADKKEREFATLQGKVSAESDKFKRDIQDCIEDIIGDVEVMLDSQKSSYVTMVLNKQDIKSDIEQHVRESVTSGVKKRFVPLVEKYVRRMNEMARIDSAGDVTVLFQFDAEELKKDMTGNVVKAIALGLIIHPIVGIISFFMGLFNQDKKREEAKRQITTKLEAEVFPSILRDVRRNLEMAVVEQEKLVNTTVENEIKTQYELLQKAIGDLQVQISDEQAEREAKRQMMNEDLRQVLEIEGMLTQYV